MINIVYIYQIQFHKGTIKTSRQETDRENGRYFNSIKVQLRQATRHVQAAQ